MPAIYKDFDTKLFNHFNFAIKHSNMYDFFYIVLDLTKFLYIQSFDKYYAKR